MVLFDPELLRGDRFGISWFRKRAIPRFLGKTLQGFPVMVWVEGRLVQRNRRFYENKSQCQRPEVRA